MTSACGVVDAVSEKVSSTADRNSFQYGDLKARGDIFEEFYYDTESLNVLKYNPVSRTYTVGDEIPTSGDSYHYPDSFDCIVLRDGVAVRIRDKKITAIFQPHLYTRTRDFYQDFADSLSLLDEVILVDIYPAREAPIPGGTSKLIYDNLRPGIEKSMCIKEEKLNILKDKNIEVLITLGAGDIDN